MTRIQVRRGPSVVWSAIDPVLDAGEPGLDNDTRDVRIGDGTGSWRQLDRLVTGGLPAPIVTDGHVITRAELEAAPSVSAFINARMAEAAASRTRVVQLPAGTFTLDYTGLRGDFGLGAPLDPAAGGGYGWSLKIPYGVWLRGAGRDSTILRMDTMAGFDTPPSGRTNRYWVCRIGDPKVGGANVRISDLTFDAERFRQNGTGFVFVVHSRFDSTFVNQHVDNVVLEDARIVGGSMGFGCGKNGNATQAVSRLTAQFTNWWCRRVEFARQSNKCIEYGEVRGCGGEDLVLDNVNAGPQVIFSSSQAVWTRVQGTVQASGFNVTEGSSDVLITDPDVVVLGGDLVDSGASRGALLIRSEPQATRSVIRGVTVRGGRLGDLTPRHSRAVAFETRPQSIGQEISGVLIDGTVLDGDVWITESLNQAQTTISDVELRGCTVTGTVHTSPVTQVAVSRVALRDNSFTQAGSPVVIRGRAWNTDGNRFAGGLTLDAAAGGCDCYRDYTPSGQVTDLGTANNPTATRVLHVD